MTMRIKIEIVPFGVESDAFEIERIDVSNQGQVKGGQGLIYGYKAKHYDQDALRQIYEGNKPEPFAEWSLNHLRTDGALKLAQLVLDRYS